MQRHFIPAPGAARVNPGVFEGQIDYLYRELPRLLIYSLVVAMLLAAMLQTAVAMNRVVTWLAAMLVVLLFRLALFLRYRARSAHSEIRTWARRYVLLAGVSGLAWGAAGIILFAPEQLEMQSLVLLVLAGMAAASASVLPMYLPAFYVFVPAAMIPSGVMMFLQHDPFHFFMGIADIVFMLGVLTFGRTIGEAFKTSLELRFENIDLVAELRDQKAELQRANQAKSKFLAAASHDLRQPMHALTLFSEMLNEKAPDQQTRDLAGHIDSAVRVLERLFDALLDISRLDAGILVPETAVFRVQDVIDRVVNDSQPQAQRKNLQLVVRKSDYYTESDPTLLERVLRNLLTNAIRYTDEGTVEVRCEAVSGGLCLSVADTGVGIDPQHLDYIFEEFTQLHNPERDRSKGLGLGLSIVRRIARLLDHQLEVESRPGKGTRFSLELPLREPTKDEIHQKRRVFPEIANLDLTIMVVDDDHEILTGTRELLESWGCNVICAANAEEALESAATISSLDAVLTDFRLPGEIQGTQLVEQIRELLGKPLPALLITGDTESTRLLEANEHGLFLLHKPVKPGRLRTWLQRLPSG